MEFLRQVRVIDPIAQIDRPMDVLLADQRIQAIAPSLDPGEAQVIEAADLIFAPALIDLYSRSGEPGHEERETLRSLAQAAAAGGFGQVNLLPTTSPAIDNPAIVSWLQQQTLFTTHLKPWGAITLGAKGEQLTELMELAAAGIVGFADGRAITNWGLLRRLLEYAQSIGKPIMLWAHDAQLANGGIAREGVEALRFGLAPTPVYAETTPLAAILEMVAEIGTTVHFMRLSTARSVALVAQAKQQGLPITASTTWLHLLYCTSDLVNYDPNLRLDPPLGNEADRQALIQAVKTGVIDAIAVDHSAYTYEEKTVAFGEAPGGAIGLELALPMLWWGLVETGLLSPIALWRSLTQGAASCVSQTLAPIEVGTTGYVLFDPGQSWSVTGLQSRSQNTHLWQRSIRGKVLRLFLE
jgi:dihydroorotase